MPSTNKVVLEIWKFEFIRPLYVALQKLLALMNHLDKQCE